MSSTDKVAIRCRRAACNNYDTDPPKFQKCGRCRLAQYCSRECQLQDWPLHKLMCHADRVIIDDDGSVIPVGAAAVAEAEGGAVSPSAALDAAKAALPEVISQSEMNDNELFAMVVDKLQLQISPFAVMQGMQVGDVPGFIFLQSETPLADFRITGRTRPVSGEKLDRSLIALYTTWHEFNNEIIVEHPNKGLRDAKLLRTLRTQLDKAKRNEELVTLAVFGCGFVGCLTEPMPPIKTVMDLINTAPDMFQGQDMLQINLDRD